MVAVVVLTGALVLVGAVVVLTGALVLVGVAVLFVVVSRRRGRATGFDVVVVIAMARFLGGIVAFEGVDGALVEVRLVEIFLVDVGDGIAAVDAVLVGDVILAGDAVLVVVALVVVEGVVALVVVEGGVIPSCKYILLEMLRSFTLSLK